MIKKAFIYLYSIPLYYLMYLIKPKRHLWIFGAWFGEKYFDNPKFFYEYVKNNHPNIKAIWLTKDKTICNDHDILYSYSIQGIYYAFFGEIYFITHSTASDLPLFINNRARKVVQLWHGIPIKKIGFDDNMSLMSYKNNNIKSKILPFLRPQYSLVISSSLDDQKNMSSAFKVDINDVKITGYPRNDILFHIDTSEALKKFKVLYAPTLRDNLDDEINLFDDFGFNTEKIIRFLHKYNIYLDIKMHPANKIDSKFKHSIDDENINFLDSKIEINDIILDYSIVISDYSGIYVDYLLTNKPIIFAPFDYEKYITKDRELYYDYNEVTPGPKCTNWEEVLEWIEKFKNDPDLFKKERKLIKDQFHKYQDGKSCERVYNEIIKL